MRFQIVCISPVYSAVHDGLVGSQARRLPNAYETERCARAVARALGSEEYQGGGDSAYHVVPYDAPLIRLRAPVQSWDALCDIPF